MKHKIIKVNSIKNPNVIHLALQEQINQGNEPSSDINLMNSKSEGNFDWCKSKQGYMFWSKIYLNKLSEAKDIYDWNK